MKSGIVKTYRRGDSTMRSVRLELTKVEDQDLYNLHVVKTVVHLPTAHPFADHISKI